MKVTLERVEKPGRVDVWILGLVTRTWAGCVTFARRRGTRDGILEVTRTRQDVLEEAIER